MAFEDFLLPDEIIQYRSPKPVEYEGELYNFYVTNDRLIWYKTKGLFFRKDSLVAVARKNVTEIKYDEEGLITKTAFLRIGMKGKTAEINGSPATIRAIYKELQS